MIQRLHFPFMYARAHGRATCNVHLSQYKPLHLRVWQRQYPLGMGLLLQALIAVKQQFAFMRIKGCTEKNHREPQ